VAKTLRIVAYAVNGAGAGHLQRLTAICRWARRYSSYCGSACEVFFLTSSEADGFLFHEGFASFKLPSKSSVTAAGIDKIAYLALAKQWVWHSLGLLRPDVLLVDTFPNGAFGELVSALDLARNRVFVYRPVKDDFARRPDFQAMLPLYDRILVPEGEETARVVLPERAGAAVRFTGPTMVRERVELRGREEARARFGLPEGRLAVLVAAGGGGDPTAEADLRRATRLLLAHDDVQVVLAAGPLYRGARWGGERITWISEPALAEWLPAFDFAVAAAGYNTVLELMHAGVPAVFLPQEKVADEQDRRAAAAVAAGAAVMVEGAGERAGLEAAIARFVDAGQRERASERARALVPRNHARDAAAEVLELVLPAHEVAAAEAAVSDTLLAAARGLGVAVEGFFELVHALVPSVPATTGTRSERRPESAASEAAASLARRAVEIGVPPIHVLKLLVPLQKRLLRGGLAERLAGAERILSCLVPFSEWGAALHLVRSLGPSREETALDVAEEVETFVARFGGEPGGLARAVAALAAAETGDPRALRALVGGRGPRG
jgi:predicted glycosyltransferase